FVLEPRTPPSPSLFPYTTLFRSLARGLRKDDDPSTFFRMASKDQGWSWLFGKLYGLLSRNPPSNRMVVELADLQPGERVLDIGGGSGSALVAAAEIVGAENVAGADPTGPLAEKVRKRIPGAEVVQAGAEDLPFPEASFDVVWTIASFH